MPRQTIALFGRQAVDARASSRSGFQFALHVGMDGLLLRLGFDEINGQLRAHQKIRRAERV